MLQLVELAGTLFCFDKEVGPRSWLVIHRTEPGELAVSVLDFSSPWLIKKFSMELWLQQICLVRGSWFVRSGSDMVKKMLGCCLKHQEGQREKDQPHIF